MMVNIELRIGARPHQIACREGQQAHYEALAALINEKIRAAETALGTMSESRLLMFAALLLADEVSDARAAGVAAPAPPDGAIALEQLAERLEGRAAALEAGAATH